jgi:hypothetical protein
VSDQGNEALAARLAELGLTRQELADRVNAAIAQGTGTPGRCAARYMRWLLSGASRWPRPVTRLALQQVLDLQCNELGFVPRSRREWARPQPPPTQRPAVAPDEVQVLSAVGGVAVYLRIPVLPAGPWLTVTDIARLSTLLDSLAEQDERHGGAGLGTLAAGYADRLVATRPSFKISARVERDLRRPTRRCVPAAGATARVAGRRSGPGRVHHPRAHPAGPPGGPPQ